MKITDHFDKDKSFSKLYHHNLLANLDGLYRYLLNVAMKIFSVFIYIFSLNIQKYPYSRIFIFKEEFEMSEN